MLAKGIVKILLYLASTALIFFGLVFLISTVPGANITGLIMLAVAGLLIYLAYERKPVEIKQTLEISGAPTVKEVRCPNCGAILDPKTVQVVDGRPYMTCTYCGNKFELTEEPKW